MDDKIDKNTYNSKLEVLKAKISSIFDLDANPKIDITINFNEMKTVIKQIRDEQVEIKEGIK